MRTAAIADYDTDAPADFNRLAPFYRWMEWFTFGPFLWKCRIAFLPEMRSRKSALILGDGDGRFTARLLSDNPHILVNAVGGSTIVPRPGAAVDELTLAEWQCLIAFNLDATFLFCHAVAPVMKGDAPAVDGRTSRGAALGEGIKRKCCSGRPTARRNSRCCRPAGFGNLCHP